MAAQIAVDTEKVAALVSSFKYSSALKEEAEQQSVRSQLQEAEQLAKKADSGAELERARELVTEAQASLQAVAEAEQAAARELAGKAELLVSAQVELEHGKGAHDEAVHSGATEARVGQQLREAKAKNEEVTKGPFQSLLDGEGWADDEAKEAALKAVQEYLEEVRAEKALVAAVAGLGIMPEARGQFDKETVNSISEVMAEKLRDLEEQLATRAPAEKEAKTELMGLAALVDICQEKVQTAEDERGAVEAALKSAKAAAKPLKTKVAKAEKAVEALLASQCLEEEKAKSATEALAAFERLCEAAASEAASTEQAEVEVEVQAEVKDSKRPADSEERDAKRARLEEPAEAVVASPARATRSRFSMPGRPAEVA